MEKRIHIVVRYTLRHDMFVIGERCWKKARADVDFSERRNT